VLLLAWSLFQQQVAAIVGTLGKLTNIPLEHDANSVLIYTFSIEKVLEHPCLDALFNALQAGISVLPVPDRPLVHPKAAAPTRIFFIAQSSRFSGRIQPALTCCGLEAQVSRALLRHRSSLVSSLCQAGVLALAARQPAGTGSAQIRWSIAPNRRRVR